MSQPNDKTKSAQQTQTTAMPTPTRDRMMPTPKDRPRARTQDVLPRDSAMARRGLTT